MPPRNNKIIMQLEEKNKLQKSLKEAYVIHNVLNNKLVKAIASKGSEKKTNQYTGNIRSVYPCLEDKETEYSIKKNEMANYISKVSNVLKKVLNLRNSAIAKSLSGKQSTNMPHRFVNAKVNGNELGHFNGLTPSLARNALNKKRSILKGIENEDFLANQVIHINENVMGASYNENENPFCNNPNNISSTTNSIKYSNLTRRSVPQTPHYQHHTESSTGRIRVVPRYGGKKKSTKKKVSKRKVSKKKSTKKSVKK